ncbi:MAG: sulfite dehydrogenase [Gemmatimonadota bacterium]
MSDNVRGRRQISRRELLAGAATVAGGALAASLPGDAQQTATPPPLAVSPQPSAPADPTKAPGTPTTAIGVRSPYVVTGRTPVGVISGSSLTPLHQFNGSIFPADLQFERHHAGVPTIDPARYTFVIHGLVDRPTTLTLDDLMTIPSVTRIHFLECAGNGRTGFKAARADLSPQLIDGMLASAEWTGVEVRTLLSEVGVKSAAGWALAEGGCAALVSRSIPLSKLADDALLVYAQNGEPLRPAGGYPVRLLLPGWEGNTSIKWIRRLELIREPNMSRDETSKYSDVLPNGTSRQFSFEMDAKSTITHPTWPTRLQKAGWVQVAGMAWSGRGRVSAVDVSVDGGRSWVEARLQGTIHPKAVVRFTHMWDWDGSPAVLMSRATDETGYTQPTLETFIAGRGVGADYHYNFIRPWNVAADGQVTYGAVI